MSLDRPRPFVTLDVAYLAQDSIQDLRDEHGPGGPLLMLQLILQANDEIPAKTKDFDVTGGRYRALARTVGVQAGEARSIMETVERLGLVERLPVDDPERYRVRLLKWAVWHPEKDPNAAKRQRRHRAKDA